MYAIHVTAVRTVRAVVKNMCKNNYIMITRYLDDSFRQFGNSRPVFKYRNIGNEE